MFIPIGGHCELLNSQNLSSGFLASDYEICKKVFYGSNLNFFHKLLFSFFPNKIEVF